MRFRLSPFLAKALVPLLIPVVAAAQGRIIAIGDEWLLSDWAFANQPAQTGQLAVNIADFFTGGQPGGNFLVASNVMPISGYGDRGVQGAPLQAAMTNAGHTWTIDPGATLTAANLAQYDGVFFAGSIGSGAANAVELASYVNGGGCVLVMAGVGGGQGGFNGGAVQEAAEWNHLLHAFGLEFGSAYFAVDPSGLLAIPTEPTGHSLGTNLTTVTWGNGQLTLDLVSNDPANQVAVRGDFTGYPAPQGRWNAIVATYNLGTVSATYTKFADGCPGSLGIPTNTATALPRLGQTMLAELGGLPPPNVAFFMLGFSRTASAFGALPLPLAAFGAPGCSAGVSPDFVRLVLGTAGVATYPWSVPSGQAFLGTQFYTQGFVVEPSINALGAIVSDAAAATIGN